MARRGEAGLDWGLADQPPDLRWREQLRRIKAVLFERASPVASVDLLIGDFAVNLEGCPDEKAQAGALWMLRALPACEPAIRSAEDVAAQPLNLSEFDIAVPATIAFHQPISRDGLKDIFGKQASRDLIAQLAERDLISSSPREPRQGAQYSFVTDEIFIAAFRMQFLRDPPDPEQLEDAGLSVPRGP